MEINIDSITGNIMALLAILVFFNESQYGEILAVTAMLNLFYSTPRFQERRGVDE